MKTLITGPRSGLSKPVVKVPFLGCNITANTDGTPVLDVIYFAEFLRGPDGTCAFCHGDPCGEDPETSPPGSLIQREIAAAPSYAPFETCPCCLGRPT